MRNNKEHQEQVAFVKWFKSSFPDLIIFSIPNDGKRTNGNRMVATGLMSGVADLQILLPNGKSVFIEMKKEKGGKLSNSQLDFIDKAQNLGHTVIIGNGCKEASFKFLEFLKEFYKKN